jgi:hypothetical protein
MPKVAAVKKDIYPYRYVRHEAFRTVKGKRYHIFSYGAYDAFGLVGPEMNGVAIGCVTDKALVLDSGHGTSYGWYDGYENDSRVQELALQVQRLANCSPAKFLEYIRTHPNWRGVSA